LKYPLTFPLNYWLSARFTDWVTDWVTHAHGQSSDQRGTVSPYFHQFLLGLRVCILLRLYFGILVVQKVSSSTSYQHLRSVSNSLSTVSKRLTPSNLREERAKHLARRKSIQNPTSSQPKTVTQKPSINNNIFPVDSPFVSTSEFNDWQKANTEKTRRKVGLFVQPYRPPAYLSSRSFASKSTKPRSSTKSSSVFPIPQSVVDHLRETAPRISTKPKPTTSSAGWKPVLFVAPFANSNSHSPGFFPGPPLRPPPSSGPEDPPAPLENIPVSNKTISKPRKAKKGKKPRTKWHCNICGLRHFSSEKQLCDHKGSFRCQARTHRDNPFRCRKCGLKCDNVVNYHRHKEARCYKNTSK